MKTLARQKEIPMPQEPFRLVAESAEDGDRIVSERDRRRREREEAEKRQTDLFAR